MELTFFATTARGLEELTGAELTALEMAGVQPGKGGVRFRGRLEDGYRACLWLRTASRVLLPLAEFDVSTPQALYDGVRGVDWARYLTPDHTLAVDCVLRDSAMTHSGFVALKSKDAIVDRLRDRFGRRPSVDARDPAVRINVHLVKNRCTVSLDLAGAPLDRRGYRLDRNDAPLRETLAAALVQLSGWDGTTPFCDPMCGSGTIVIEAALKAARIAPGLIRSGFGFQRWPGFDQGVWQRLVEEARAGMLPKLAAPIVGSDKVAATVTLAAQNCRRAGVTKLVSLAQGDIRDFTPPPGPGVILCNPPYGERLGEVEQLKPLYRQMGDVFKQRCTGYVAHLLCGNLELAKHVGLKASRRVVLWNGPLECRLLKYDLF